MNAPAALPFDGAVPSAGLELELAPVRSLFAECRDCAACHAFPSTIGLPAGWREVPDELAANGKAVLCPDCREHGDELGDEPTTPAFVHTGFRLSFVTHLAAGFATVSIHGGSRRRAGVPDHGAKFLADADGLGALIEQLTAIRADLTKGETDQ